MADKKDAQQEQAQVASQQSSSQPSLGELKTGEYLIHVFPQRFFLTVRFTLKRQEPLDIPRT